MFVRRDKDGNEIQRKVTLDCSADPLLTEQSHKEAVKISNIVKKHGIDLIQQTSRIINDLDFRMDENPYNDFQEAMFIVAKAKSTFEQVPAVLRKKFDNNPAKFVDFVKNPDNYDKLVEYGLANPKPEEVVSPNPAESPAG